MFFTTNLLDKLARYNVINFIVPGAVFSLYIKEIGTFTMLPEDIISRIALFYFAGLVISRIGSIIIEPLLLKLNIIKHRNYSSFLAASSKDPKISVFLEDRNAYRSLIALIISIALFRTLDFISKTLSVQANQTLLEGLHLLFLFFLFLIAYKKQTQYIADRIDNITSLRTDNKQNEQ